MADVTTLASSLESIQKRFEKVQTDFRDMQLQQFEMASRAPEGFAVDFQNTPFGLKANMRFVGEQDPRIQMAQNLERQQAERVFTQQKALAELNAQLDTDQKLKLARVAEQSRIRLAAMDAIAAFDAGGLTGMAPEEAGRRLAPVMNLVRQATAEGQPLPGFASFVAKSFAPEVGDFIASQFGNDAQGIAIREALQIRGGAASPAGALPQPVESVQEQRKGATTQGPTFARTGTLQTQTPGQMRPEPGSVEPRPRTATPGPPAAPGRVESMPGQGGTSPLQGRAGGSLVEAKGQELSRNIGLDPNSTEGRRTALMASLTLVPGISEAAAAEAADRIINEEQLRLRRDVESEQLRGQQAQNVMGSIAEAANTAVNNLTQRDVFGRRVRPPFEVKAGKEGEPDTAKVSINPETIRGDAEQLAAVRAALGERLGPELTDQDRARVLKQVVDKMPTLSQTVARKAEQFGLKENKEEGVLEFHVDEVVAEPRTGRLLFIGHRKAGSRVPFMAGSPDVFGPLDIVGGAGRIESTVGKFALTEQGLAELAAARNYTTGNVFPKARIIVKGAGKVRNTRFGIRPAEGFVTEISIPK